MRAIILIALFAFAAQAFYINSTAYTQGFMDQLNLDVSQLQDANNCYAAIQQAMLDVQNVFAAKSQGDAQVVLAVVDLISEVHTTVQAECTAYFVDLVEYFTNNTNGDVKQTIMNNFQNYTEQIIQQVAIWTEQYADQKDYQAGQTEAYIFQILLGVEQPELLPTPQFNMSNYVTFDSDKFYGEFYQGFLSTIGFTNQTEIELVTQCGVLMSNATQALIMMGQGFPGQNINEKIVTLESTVQVVLAAVDACITSYQVEKPYYETAWNQFKVLPLLNVIQLAYNVASNLPEIQQAHEQLVVDVLGGLYEQAGVDQGDIQNMIFKGILAF
jgi:hypothetical protein